MTKILNLTQHEATQEQKEAGVIDLPAEMRAELVDALTFTYCPDSTVVRARAERIAQLCSDYWNHLNANYLSTRTTFFTAMIGGAPYLMAPLERALNAQRIPAVYAFSERVSTETEKADGSIVKTSYFRHAGWVAAS